MKILYAIQATGNGHLSRAAEIIPHLKKYGEPDLLLSGTQADIDIPFPVKYRKKGMSFVFGKQGGIDYWETYRQLNSATLMKEVLGFPIQDYDVIINDYEPITAWAGYFRNKPVIGMSHQSAFHSHKVPRPDDRERFGEFILRSYAPCSTPVGFHFKKYDDFIYTPVLQKRVRTMVAGDKGYYTVYLPAYGDDKIISTLKSIPVKWQVFSKHSKAAYTHENFTITPVNADMYYESLAQCRGLLTGAGFESPAEALLLGKKLMVIPMKGQYEQKCNAAALREMGVPVLQELNDESVAPILNWIETEERLQVDFPDNTALVLENIFYNTNHQSVYLPLV